MFWISAALIVFFVLMAMRSRSCSPARTRHFADLSKAREAPSADAWFGRDSQGYDVYARTVYGARASILVGILATLFTLIFGSVGRHHLPATAAAGSIRCSSRIGEIFLGIPLLLGGILFLYTFPNPVDDPIRGLRRQGRLRAWHPGLAVDHAADALQRAAGQTERLRPGGPGARRDSVPDHQLPHPAQLVRLR